MKTQAENKKQYAFTLKIGGWREFISEKLLLVNIAEALNDTITKCNIDFEINGYLITSTKIYLIISVLEFSVQEVLDDFYKNVRLIIKPKLFKNDYDSKNKINLNYDEIEENTLRLFEKVPLRNNYLIKLLCGQQINLIYSDPRLEILKKQLNNYNFCSMTDYSGVVGPVILKRPKTDLIS